jgi:hypothetical protein
VGNPNNAGPNTAIETHFMAFVRILDTSSLHSPREWHLPWKIEPAWKIEPGKFLPIGPHVYSDWLPRIRFVIDSMDSLGCAFVLPNCHPCIRVMKTLRGNMSIFLLFVIP